MVLQIENRGFEILYTHAAMHVGKKTYGSGMANLTVNDDLTEWAAMRLPASPIHIDLQVGDHFIYYTCAGT